MKYLLLIVSLLLPLAGKGQMFDLINEHNRISFGFDAEHDFILVKVRFANVLPLNFIFDTGSEHTILFKKEYADLLGITYDRKIPLFGADLASEVYAYIARNVDLNIENEFPFQSDVLVMESDFLQLEEFTGINIDGIIGANLFRHFVLHINNRRNQITMISPNHFEVPGNRYQEFDIDVQQSKPYLIAQAGIAGKDLELKLLLDTGASLPLLLYTNTHQDLKLPDHTILGNLGMGLGGFLQGYIGRVDHLHFANYKFDQLVTSFQEVQIDSLIRDQSKRNGIIGNSLLGRYDVYIDYPRNKLYLKPNRKYRKKFRYDKSGLVLVAAGPDLKSFIVQRVVEDSPAAEAGFRIGDLVRSVKGIPSSFYTLAAINSILSGKPGKNIRMVISRSGKRQKMKIKLRDLI